MLPYNLYVLMLSLKSDLGVNAFATGKSITIDIMPSNVAASTGFMSTRNELESLNQLLIKNAQVFYLTTFFYSKITGISCTNLSKLCFQKNCRACNYFSKPIVEIISKPKIKKIDICYIEVL